jgi:hypothetical protein
MANEKVTTIHVANHGRAQIRRAVRSIVQYGPARTLIQIKAICPLFSDILRCSDRLTVRDERTPHYP